MIINKKLTLLSLMSLNLNFANENEGKKDPLDFISKHLPESIAPYFTLQNVTLVGALAAAAGAIIKNIKQLLIGAIVVGLIILGY